jgi:murein DD-endopeptidase MepM/ murein hydrolase activator NlpD
MRARTIASFVLGFAVGVLCLGVGLWSTGALRGVTGPVWIGNRINPSLPAPPANLNPTAQLPAPPVPPPEGPPPVPTSPATSATTPPAATAAGTPVSTAATSASTPASQGSADRSANNGGTPGAAAPLHLSMPISGIDPSTLADSFHQIHNGHEHEAVDIPAARNTPVHAAIEGTVAKLFTSKQGGLTVYQFDDSQQYCVYYAHLDHYAKGLKEGTLLRVGDVLGYVGSTGNAEASAPHLHLAVFKLGPDKKWWKGTALDPLPMLK